MLAIWSLIPVPFMPPQDGYMQWWWLVNCMLLSRFSHVRLCDPRDDSPPGSPVPGILQARIVEWVAISFSDAWKWKVKSESEVAQSCLTLSDLVDCSLPGSSIYGVFQARVLEWGAIAFSMNCIERDKQWLLSRSLVTWIPFTGELAAGQTCPSATEYKATIRD